MNLTASRLREALSYNPTTGVFLWVKPSGRRVKAGQQAGNPYSNGYLRVQLDGTEYLLHRLAWLWMEGEWPIDEVDHRNRNRADNRWVNLRPATPEQNKQNTAVRSDNISGARGVHWDTARQKWHASVCTNGVRKFLGYFADRAMAAEAARNARIENHGEFAN